MATGDTASDSLPAAAAKRRRGGIAHVSAERQQSWPHRPIRPQHRQRAQPGTRPGRSDSQAVNNTKRQASKWRCPTGECQPASVWIKADRLHTLIPRSTDRWKALYHQRGAVEREFGRLKHEWAMLPLRVRRLERVRLHVDLTILAKLASALLSTRM